MILELRINTPTDLCDSVAIQKTNHNLSTLASICKKVMALQEIVLAARLIVKTAKNGDSV